MKRYFRKTAKIALVLIYLVIVAGAVVRMTGSGMGCPDWPKCFGYYIPPTELSELQFKPNHEYKKGVVIIVDETLQVATKDFTSSEIRNVENWEAYTEHDYAKFNPLHTWVEYINRLIGALSGIPILMFTIMSFWLWKDKKRYLVLSLSTVFGMAFQAWLGKTVVDSNLAPYKITIHMVMALVIVAFILYLIFLSKTSFKKQLFHSKFNTIMGVAIVLSLIQIVLGTQVREYVDEEVKLAGTLEMHNTSTLPLSFYIHRTFSIAILLVNVWLFRLNRKLGLGYRKINLVMLCIIAEIITGVSMYYFEFPFGTQPLHIVIATIMIGIQFYIFMESRKREAKIEATTQV
ncbi:COX15/CtaA family protein [Winogradskyella maritima]|uniref:Heme A synthase n=1 Tax=Winogradskyella maritima TaxID=1517766 RepID=A0ABV8ANE3_9FLAO|nr:COX15/CtaA family protein [Winogradskyella maritima]